MELVLGQDRTITVDLGKGTSIEAKILPTDRIAELRAKHRKTDIRRGIPVEDFDHVSYSSDFWDETILSWQGLTQNGSPIPCTKDNKFLVVTKYEEIAGRISERIEEEKAKTLAAEAMVRGNS